MRSVYEQLNDRLQERGKKITDLEKNGVIYKNLYYQYKKYYPTLMTMIKIANNLEMSIDYILERKNTNKFKKYDTKQANFFTNLMKILNSRGLTQTKVIVDLHFSKGNFSDWKNGSYPKMPTLISLANYLKLDIDDLLEHED